MFSLLALQSYSIYEHTTNSSNTLRYFSIRIEDQNKSVNKKDIEIEEDNGTKEEKYMGVKSKKRKRMNTMNKMNPKHINPLEYSMSL
jgi:hypothetical protein